MEDYSAMIRSAFEMGSIADAQSLFFTCVKSAFPTNDFRRLELLRFVREDQYMEGRSLNHVFEMQAAIYNDNQYRYRNQKIRNEKQKCHFLPSPLSILLPLFPQLS